MSKNDIKTAMDALQVSKPLRLKSQEFKAPIPPVKSSVENSSLVKDQTQGESTTWDANVTQDQLISQVSPANEDTKPNDDVNKKTLDEFGTLDRKTTLVEMSSQVTSETQGNFSSEDQNTSMDDNSDRMIPRKSQPRKATSQDQSMFDLLQFKDKLGKGYTRIPNSILMDLLSGEMSPTEMKIVLLIARMTIGFQNRKFAPLSKKVIETLASSQGGAILQALQSLEKSGKIRKIAGNQMNPNQFGLVFDESVFDLFRPSKSVTV